MIFFSFDLTGFDWSTYAETIVRGVRIHLFKQEESSLPAARKRMDNIRRIRDLLTLTFTTLPAYWVINYHLKRGGALADLLRFLYRILMAPSNAAKSVLMASLRRITGARPAAIAMQ